MSSRSVQPTAAEIRAVAEILYRNDWPGARKKLKPFMDGRARWSSAARTVRGILKEVSRDPRRAARLPIRDLDALIFFGGTYGTETRAPQGTEALTVIKTMRWTQSEWAGIERAAKAAGMTPAEWVRGAAAKAAEEAEEAA